MLTEIEDEALAVAPDDRYKNLKMDPETKARVSAAATAAVEGAIDFTKSLGELAADTIVYFRTGQYLLDSVKGLTGIDLTPASQKEWRSTIAAASLHDFLDKFGTGGLDAADLINAAIYMFEKNWKMAALCGVAAIPVVGTAIKNAKLGKTSKFLINDIKALDDGIASLEEGLRKTGDPNAELVISEVKNVRAEMNGGKANFEPINMRRATAEEIAKNPEVLANASKLINEVKVDPAAFFATRQLDPVSRGGKFVLPTGWFASADSILDTPEKVFKAKKFTADAKVLFGKIGSDVTVKPVVGSQEVVNKTLASIGLDVFTDRGIYRARVGITTADEAKAAIEELNKTMAQGKKLSADDIGPDKITVIPVANAAGKDTIPSAWMIAHAFFDGGYGSLLLDGMPKTKAIVNEVQRIFDYMNKFKTPDLPRHLQPDAALGLTVNSGWGRNARELLKQQDAGADLSKIAAPAIGKTVKPGEKLPDFDWDKIQGTQAGIFRASDYANRPTLDNMSEILSAALTKSVGYNPKFSHIPADHPNRDLIIEAAEEIQRLTSGIKEAFNADARGKVIWIAVN